MPDLILLHPKSRAAETAVASPGPVSYFVTKIYYGYLARHDRFHICIAIWWSAFEQIGCLVLLPLIVLVSWESVTTTTYELIRR